MTVHRQVLKATKCDTGSALPNAFQLVEIGSKAGSGKEKNVNIQLQ